MAIRLQDGYKKIFEKILKTDDSTSFSKKTLAYFPFLKSYVFLAFQFNLAEIMGLFILSAFTSMTSYGNFFYSMITVLFYLSFHLVPIKASLTFINNAEY